MSNLNTLSFDKRNKEQLTIQDYFDQIEQTDNKIEEKMKKQMKIQVKSGILSSKKLN